MDRQIIFGVCDKTDKCNSYFGFFKNEEDAKKEVSIQAKRLKEDLGMMDIQIKDDRAVIMDGDKEINVIVIHSYVVR